MYLILIANKTKKGAYALEFRFINYPVFRIDYSSDRHQPLIQFSRLQKIMESFHFIYKFTFYNSTEISTGGRNKHFSVEESADGA
jgi:hypothetical protein